MNGALLAILGASLLGSVHCAAMCGGFVCFYADQRQAPTSHASRLHAHAMYNVGRLLAYATLGAAAGTVGAHVTHLSTLVGLSRGAAILSGSLLILWSLSELFSRSNIRGLSGATRSRVPLAWQKGAGAVLLRIQKQPQSVRALTTGLLTGALPCGWLYVFVAAAGGTGSPLRGMVSMFVFWLGTVPALLAVGIGAQRLLMPLRQRFPQIGAAVVLVTGILTVSGRLAFSHGH